MKTLTIEKARDIAHSVSLQIQPKSLSEFFIIHSEKVGLVADLIAQKMNLRNDIFLIAGWVHDIGYARDLENHALHGIPMLEEMGYEVGDILRDCILNHGSTKKTETVEGRIFQLADKLSVFDLDLVTLLVNAEDFPKNANDAFFLKEMSDSAIELLKKFGR